VIGSWSGVYSGTPVKIRITQGAGTDSTRPDLLDVTIGTESYHFAGMFAGRVFNGSKSVPLGRGGGAPYTLVSITADGDLQVENLSETGMRDTPNFKRSDD